MPATCWCCWVRRTTWPAPRCASCKANEANGVRLVFQRVPSFRPPLGLGNHGPVEPLGELRAKRFGSEHAALVHAFANANEILLAHAAPHELSVTGPATG